MSVSREEFMSLVARVEGLEQHLGVYGVDYHLDPWRGTKCPNCHHVYPGGPRLCPNCDEGEIETVLLPPRGTKR